MSTVIGDASIRIVIDDSQARKQVDKAEQDRVEGRDGPGRPADPPPERIAPSPAPGGPNPNATGTEGGKRPRPTPQPKPDSPGEAEVSGDPPGAPAPGKRPGGRTPPSVERGRIGWTVSPSTIRDVFSSRSPVALANAGARGAFPGIVRAAGPLLAAGAAAVGTALAAERFGPSLQGAAAAFGSGEGDFGGGVADVIAEVGKGVTDFRNSLSAAKAAFGDVVDLVSTSNLSGAGSADITLNDAVSIGTRFQRVGKARLDIEAAAERARGRKSWEAGTRYLMEANGMLTAAQTELIRVFLIDSARQNGGR